MDRIEPTIGQPPEGTIDASYVPSQVRLKQGRSGLLPHEKAGRVIRLLAIISAIGAIGIIAAIVIPLFAPNSPPMHTAALPIALAFIAFIALIVLLLSIASAVMRHRPWGRVAGIVYGCVLLLGFPIGTLIGFYILWHLIGGWGEGYDNEVA